MKRYLVIAEVLMAPALAHAQNPEGARGGAAAGAATGAVGGAIVGGPVGAVVGGMGGAVVGGVAGDATPRSRPTYAPTKCRPTPTAKTFGLVLPESGVTYREVPSEFGTNGDRYTVFNDRTVIIEPQSRRIIQVIE